MTISSIPSLSKAFPTLWTQVSELASELQAGLYSRWSPVMERLSFLSDPDFIADMEICIPGWRKISTVQNGTTAKHTILVLVTCLNLPEYEQASPLTRQEIEWAALLHDIDKNVSGGRDFTHPFRSAAIAIQAMQILGFEVQPGVTAEELEDWAKLVMSSEHEVDGKIVHDHSRLKEIVEGIHRHWGQDTSPSRILKAILFHQSLPTLKDWTNPVLLNDDELRYSLSISDMEVLGPLLIADSDSWNIFDEPRFAYLDELRANIMETHRRISGGV